MRFLLAALVVLGASIGLALIARHDPGYVLINYAGWSVESSLTLFILILIVTFIAFHIALRLFTGTWHLPKRLAFWQRHRRAVRSRKRTNLGLIALAEGNWVKAERLLSRAARFSDTPLINYLGAARAAQKQDSEQRRDQYLSQAYQSMPKAELAVGLTQADVQLSQGQTEQALATLRHLRSIAPKHAYVLYLLKKLYEKLESWEDLLELLPELRRQNVISAERLAEVEHRVHRMRLDAAEGDLEHLRQYWEEMPRPLRSAPDMIQQYCELLRKVGAGEEAETILHGFLKREWNPQLMRIFGQVQGADPAQQLATAERWLREHEHHPELLLACGRISLCNKLWGKARSYLEASLGIDARAETCYELGNLLYQLDEKDKAAEYFRQGMEISNGDSCTNITVTPPHRATGAVAGEALELG